MYFYKVPAIAILTQFSFPSSQRLKSRKLIQQLYEHGKSIQEYPLRAVWKLAKLDTPLPLQIGFAVSKKLYPRAVERNRAKRVMRESFRLEQQRIKPFLESHGLQVAIMLMYTGKELKSLNTLQPKIILILARLQHVLEGDTQES